MILYFLCVLGVLCVRKRKKDHAKIAKSAEKKKEGILSENEIVTHIVDTAV